MGGLTNSRPRPWAGGLMAAADWATMLVASDRVDLWLSWRFGRRCAGDASKRTITTVDV
jgi:hypothetical protein